MSHNFRSLVLILFFCLILSPLPLKAGSFQSSPTLQEAWKNLSGTDSFHILRQENGKAVTLLMDSPDGKGETFTTERILPLFHPGSGLELEPIPAVSNSSAQDFNQMVAGKPVFRCGLRVLPAKHGGVRMVCGTLTEARPSRPDFMLGAEEARRLAADLLRERLVGKEAQTPAVDVSPARAGWFPQNGVLLPCWEVEAAVDNPRPTEERFYISAADGDLLALENRLFTGAIQNYPGRGRVYRTHPLDSPLEEVRFEQLTMPDRLMGAFFFVTNSAGPAAVATDRLFFYTPQDIHFDEVMAYYHFERARIYFTDRLGFPGLANLHTVAVHYGHNYDNAFYSPRFRKFAFGDGDLFNDFARDAGIIYHEYTHAVTAALAPDIYGTEAGAMNEAFSDYFAAVLTGDPRMGAWIVAPTGAPWLRNLDCDARWPRDMTDEIHLASLIFSAPLWDLRKRIRPGECDRMIHASTAALRGEVRFTDGLAALVAADLNLHAGRNRTAILETFARRGLLLERLDPETSRTAPADPDNRKELDQ